MPEPEHRPRVEQRQEPPPPEREDSREDDESFWQWVALVVLLACWLAEASF